MANIKRNKLISNIILTIVILGGIIWVCSRFVHLGNVEYTDNAQIKQHITPINTRVQGFIKKIYFDEYQPVHKGDTLLIIEDSEFRLRLAQAEANYLNATAGKNAMHTTINTTQSNLSVTEAGIREAQVRLKNAETDYKRYSEMLKQKAVTPQQYDRVKTEYEAAKARYEQISRQKQSTNLVKQEQTQRLEQNEAAIRVAEAEVNLARLNLSYTVIIATADGMTGRKNIHEGQLVQPGQTMVSIIDNSEKWIIANYKETQTTQMKNGQKVRISIDALPGKSMSLMPQDNSAGNFVKVEQRIPVKIEFTQESKPEDIALLRAGMNVECKVEY